VVSPPAGDLDPDRRARRRLRGGDGEDRGWRGRRRARRGIPRACAAPAAAACARAPSSSGLTRCAPLVLFARLTGVQGGGWQRQHHAAPPVEPDGMRGHGLARRHEQRCAPAQPPPALLGGRYLRAPQLPRPHAWRLALAPSGPSQASSRRVRLAPPHATATSPHLTHPPAPRWQTYIGPILIAVNPYKAIPIFSPGYVDKYYNQGAADVSSAPPNLPAYPLASSAPL
jgi:hypothetical protein